MMQEIFQLVQAMHERLKVIEDHVFQMRTRIDTAAIEAGETEPVPLSVAGMPDNAPGPVTVAPVLPSGPGALPAAGGVPLPGATTMGICPRCGAPRANASAPCRNCTFQPEQNN
jgi:hypothetical protein